MSEKYLIDKNSKTLIFTGNPKSLNKHSVSVADENAFTSVVIPNSVRTIDENTFPHSSLSSIHIPNSVSTIGYSAFAYCTSLASIHIPNSVSAIYGGAFVYCSHLASTHFSNSISTINGQAFASCSHLHKAYLMGASKIYASGNYSSFRPQTSLLRPRLKPIAFLQKKPACRASKTSYSIYL